MDDIDLPSPGVVIGPGDAGKLGGHPEGAVGTGTAPLGTRRRHAALSETEIQQLVNIRPVFQQNILADDADILLDTLSLEEILLRDPSYIFITTMGDPEAAQDYVRSLFAQEGWQDLSAVQSGCYTFLSKDMFHFKPNQNWAEAYRLLAQLLYPDLEIV